MVKIILSLLGCIFLFACNEKKQQSSVILAHQEAKVENYIPPYNNASPYLITSQPLKDSLLEIFYEEVILAGRERKELVFFQKIKNEGGTDKYWDTLLTYCEGYNHSNREKSIEARKSYLFSPSLIYKFSRKSQDFWAVTGNFTCDMHKCNEFHLFKSSKKNSISSMGFVDDIYGLDSVHFAQNGLFSIFYRDYNKEKKKLSLTKKWHLKKQFIYPRKNLQ